jgi:hypothetical protein
LLILVTREVLKLEISREAKERQLENIESILVTSEVLKLEKSREFKKRKEENIIYGKI